MKRILHLCRIMIQLIHQLNRSNQRDCVVVVTIFVGLVLYFVTTASISQDGVATTSKIVDFIVQSVTWINGYSKWTIYYTNLSVSFIKSFLIFLVVEYVFCKTYSRRIVIFLALLLTSMLMDLGSILSTDIYYALKPFRYENTLDYIAFTVSISFQSLYTYFEVACVLFTSGKLGWNYLNDRASSNSNNDSWLFSPSFHTCIDGKSFTRQTNKISSYSPNKRRS